MEYLTWFGWLVFFSLLASTIFWLYDSARMTFMLIRGERSQKEDKKYNRIGTILIYMIIGGLLLSWLGIIVTEILYASYGLGTNTLIEISIVLPLIGLIVGIYSTLLGIIYFPRKGMKIAALITHIFCIGGGYQAGCFIVLWFHYT